MQSIRNPRDPKLVELNITGCQSCGWNHDREWIYASKHGLYYICPLTFKEVPFKLPSP